MDMDGAKSKKKDKTSTSQEKEKGGQRKKGCVQYIEMTEIAPSPSASSITQVKETKIDPPVGERRVEEWMVNQMRALAASAPKEPPPKESPPKESSKEASPNGMENMEPLFIPKIGRLPTEIEINAKGKPALRVRLQEAPKGYEQWVRVISTKNISMADKVVLFISLWMIQKRLCEAEISISTQPIAFAYFDGGFFQPSAFQLWLRSYGYVPVVAP